MSSRIGRYIVELAMLAALYFGLGQICLKLDLVRGNAVLLWPPTGLALAVLLIRGQRLWPGVAAGSLLIVLSLEPAARALLPALGMVLGNTLAPVVATRLLTHHCDFRIALDRLRDVLAFIVFGVLLGTAISALIGTTTLALGGYTSWPRFWLVLVKWIAAHAQAVLVLTPFLLAWAARPTMRPINPSRLGEASFVGIAVVGIAYLLFVSPLAPVLKNYPLTFVLYPLIVWAALRFGSVGSTTTVVLVSALAVWGTSHGRGPFGSERPEESMMLISCFLAVLAVVALVVTAMMQERKTALSSLSQTERQYQTLFDNDPDGIMVLDPATMRAITVNDSLVRLLGFSSQELLHLTLMEYEAAEVENGVRAHVSRILQDGGADFETKLRTRDDRRLDVVIRARALDLGGRRALYCIIRDTTDRKQAEQALQASEEKYRFLFEENVAGVFYSTIDGKVRGCNEAFARILGYDSPQDAMSGPAVRFYANPQAREHYLAQLTATGSLSAYEIELRRKDGAQVWVMENVSLMKGEDGRQDLIIGTLVDITKHKMAQVRLKQAFDELERRVAERTAELLQVNRSLQQEISDRVDAEKELRESEERFRQLCNATFEGLAIHEQGRIMEVNDALARMFGYTKNEMIGMSRFDLIAPSAQAAAREYLRAHLPAEPDRPLETWGIKKDGTVFPIEFRGKAMPYRGRMVRVKAIRDLTDRHRAQEEADQHREDLAHVLRLATMGEMAAGLAHELNQPLAAIVNYTQGSARRLRSGDGDMDQVATAIESATKQAQRAGEIIKRMRDLARKRDPQTVPVDLNTLVRNAIDVLGGETRKAGVSLHLRLQHDLPSLRADPVQIEQVVINLIKNACEAASQAAPDRRIVEVATHLSREKEVEVCVRDSGPGLSAETADKIFQPFFTTKPRGMGMGLSISRSIIEAHGGRMEVRVHPDVGVTLAFALPVGN